MEQRPKRGERPMSKALWTEGVASRGEGLLGGGLLCSRQSKETLGLEPMNKRVLGDAGVKQGVWEAIHARPCGHVRTLA